MSRSGKQFKYYKCNISIKSANQKGPRAIPFFLAEFYQTVKEKLMLIVIKLCKKKKTEIERILTNLFHEATVTLIAIPIKTQQKNFQTIFPYEYG